MAAAKPPDPPQRTDLRSVMWTDLRRSDLAGSVSRDVRDLYRFYLDGESRRRLEAMGRPRRTFWVLGWLFRSLLLKLTPARRALLLGALILAILGWTEFVLGGLTVRFDFRPWGFLLLLVVLMLELKDKLLAKDEIQVARQVQRALLPREQPVVDGWEVWGFSVPANDVGGDLVDYVDLGAGRLGAVLGDVSGKGLGAALLAAKLQATLRALAPDSPSLDELGERMNTILLSDGLANRYSTMFYAELSPESGHVRYLNAGHNPPIVVRADDHITLRPSGRPLGMLSGSSYLEGSLELEDGELLAVYSDGITEAENHAGEEFGTARLETLLRERARDPLDVAGRAILDEVDRFTGGERPSDDRSLVLARRSVLS